MSQKTSPSLESSMEWHGKASQHANQQNFDLIFIKQIDIKPNLINNLISNIIIYL